MTRIAKSPTHRWIPWLFALMFVPVLAVNVLLMRLAFSSNTGLVTDHAFDTGQSYNQVIAAGQQSRALGWTAEVSLTKTGSANQARLQVTVSDRNGAALPGLQISGRLYSPVDPQPDQTISLNDRGEGRYDQTLCLPRDGQWDAQLLASNQASEHFAVDQRLILR